MGITCLDLTERGKAVMEDEALQAVGGSRRGRVLLEKARHFFQPPPPVT